MGKQVKEVKAYIKTAPPEAQSKMREIRKAILDAAPKSKESVSYGMAHYAYLGRLAWLGYHTNHVGLYLRPPVVADHRKELAGYTTTKSAVHFPLDKKVDVSLVKKLVKARVAINESEWAERQAKRRGSKPLKAQSARRA